MRRMLGAGIGLLLTLILLVPAAVAADPSVAHTGRVLIATDGDITVPAGEQADAVIVVNGTATIEGDVNAVVVVDGTAVLTGAAVETLVSIRSPVTLGPGTVVKGDLFKLDALVTKTGDGNVQGEIRDVAAQLTGVGFILAPLFILFFLGFMVATLAAGLLLAALAARQVRAAGELITHRPVETLVVGIVGTIAPIFIVIALFVTVVGIPLALALVLAAWPLAAFLGYLVAGIWIGDWVLHRASPDRIRERPYLASVIGLLILAVLSVWPFLSAIASIFGYGAVLMLAWRTFRGQAASETRTHTGTAAPMPA
jgi:hypothetical protein